MSQRLSQALRRWFAKRAPRSDHATLNLGNVYIFFSREGLLFAVLLLITLIAGINYANNLVLGLCFYLLSVWLVSIYLTFVQVAGLQVRLLEVTMTEAGTELWVTLQIYSQSQQPSRQLLVNFQPQSGQSFEQSLELRGSQSADNRQHYYKSAIAKQTQLLLPRLQDQQVIRLCVPTYHRGELQLPPLQIKTVYPLGIMRAWAYVYFARTAWVYPKPEAFAWQALSLTISSETLPTAGQYVAGQDDFEHLDNYIEGQSLARVSWAQVARGQGMFSKHFTDTVSANNERRLAYADMPALSHEQKLAQLAYAVLMLGQLNVPFQMQLPDEVNLAATSGQGTAFAQSCLLRLAKMP
jgi:uncharacterized protein (DUF58 family)